MQYVANCTTAVGERVAVWLSHTVLLEQFKKQEPEPGERVGIKYHGPHPEKKYEQYTLKVDRDTEQQVPDFTDGVTTDKAAVNASKEDAEQAARASGEELSDAVAEQRKQTAGDKVADKVSERRNCDDDIPF